MTLGLSRTVGVGLLRMLVDELLFHLSSELLLHALEQLLCLTNRFEKRTIVKQCQEKYLTMHETITRSLLNVKGQNRSR